MKRIVAKVRRLAEKNRGTEATPALAQPDTDETNGNDDANAKPAVSKDERGDASENRRSVQQHNSDQTPAHPEIDDDKLVKDIITAGGGSLTTAQIRAVKEEVARRRRPEKRENDKSTGQIEVCCGPRVSGQSYCRLQSPDQLPSNYHGSNV